MKLLLIHSDHMEYSVTKPIKGLAEQGMDDKGQMEECLVAFCSVESRDARYIEDVVSEAVQYITGLASNVKTDRIMLYPYAHLSSDLAGSSDAVKVLKRLEKAVADAGLVVK
ncbi:MAG TPA: threonine--tRNA ligase, partial [Euryarchaeota archaeon]|nr:threonine--tRNA ligase [Euryarchaeota archaeon]